MLPTHVKILNHEFKFEGPKILHRKTEALYINLYRNLYRNKLMIKNKGSEIEEDYADIINRLTKYSC